MGRAVAGPAITVAVCTRDRSELLPGCFDAVQAQIEPLGGLKIVEVDDGSVDATPILLAAADRRDRRIRWFCQRPS